MSKAYVKYIFKLYNTDIPDTVFYIWPVSDIIYCCSGLVGTAFTFTTYKQEDKRTWLQVFLVKIFPLCKYNQNNDSSSTFWLYSFIKVERLLRNLKKSHSEVVKVYSTLSINQPLTSRFLFNIHQVPYSSYFIYWLL